MRTLFNLLLFVFLHLPVFLVAQDTLLLQPGPEGKDAILNSYWNFNLGDNTNLFSLGWTHSGMPFVSRAIMDFDLSAIPLNSYIIEAKLSLFFAINPSNPGLYQTPENQAQLRKIITPWDEHEVTWLTQPLTSDEFAVLLPASQFPDQDYPDIDVTGIIRDKYLNPDTHHGLMLQLDNEFPYHAMCFASGDCLDPELRPKLEIIYLNCIPPEVDFDYQVDELTVNFTGISLTAESWHWDFGDGDTSNIQNPEHVYLEQGIYTVCLRVEDTCHFSEYCEEIEICVFPPTAGFTYTIDGQSVFFQNTSTPASGYFWDFDDGYFSSLSDPWHHYDSSGVYLVCLTTWNDCGADTACTWIDICVSPLAGFYYYTDDLTAFFQNTSLDAEEYYWDFGDGYYSNLVNPIHIYDYPGTYTACLMTWNECGADTVCLEVYISLVGLDEADGEMFRIYPNPATSQLTVGSWQLAESIMQSSVRLIITDLYGRKIQEFSEIGSFPIQVDISGLSDGLYVIRITDEIGHVSTQKFLKISP